MDTSTADIDCLDHDEIDDLDREIHQDVYVEHDDVSTKYYALIYYICIYVLHFYCIFHVIVQIFDKLGLIKFGARFRRKI